MGKEIQKVNAERQRQKFSKAFKLNAMQSELSLSILKCSIIVFGVMQKSATKYPLNSPISFTLVVKLQHNSDDLPVH